MPRKENHFLFVQQLETRPAKTSKE